MKNKTRNDHAFSVSQRFLLGWAALLLAATGVRAQNVSTVVSDNLFEPNSVAIDSSGNAYITDTQFDIIVKFAPSTAALTSLAGLASQPGSSSGPGTEARFAQPMGLVAARGGLVVVDQGNQLIRFVSFTGVVSNNPIAGVLGKTGANNGPGASATFSFPSGITADAAGNLYVADQGNNLIRKIDTANNVSTITNTNGYVFVQPTGVAVDNYGNIWVSDTGNQVICMISNQSVYVIAGTPGVSGFDDSYSAATSLFSLPTALLLIPTNNSFLIADTGNDVLRSLYLTNLYGTPTYLVQTVAGIAGVAGNVDGKPGVSEFSAPVGLSVDTFDFGYYVIDRNGAGSIGRGIQANGALRVYQATTPLPPPTPPVLGYVTFTQPQPSSPSVTQFTAAPEAVFNNSAIIAVEAQANTQTYITYGPTGSAIPTPGPTSGFAPQTYLGDGQTTAAPTIVGPLPDMTIEAVSQGPTGELSTNVTARYQWIVANPIITGVNAASLQLSDITVGAALYYTLDGNAPTNGAADTFGPLFSGATLSLAITNNVTLSVRGFHDNFAPSGVASLQLTVSNYIPNIVNFSGQSKTGSTGATLAVPVFVSMATINTPLQSIQFRAEVAPTGGNPNMVSPLTDLSITPVDFVTYPGLAGTNELFEYFPYTLGSAQGVTIVNYTNSGMDISGNGTVALVEIPIPDTVTYGQTYTLAIINPSGTSDGNQANVALNGFTNTLTITDPIYLAGDSSPANGYNASEFGNGILNNADVNNAMYASVGIRVPPVFTDAYDDMDVYPPDNGDGLITLLDWQTILNRATGLDTNNWIRFHTNGGVLMHQQVAWSPTGPAIPLAKAEPRMALKKNSAGQTPPGLVWLRQAAFGAVTQTGVAPGSVCSIPVFVNVGSGSSLSGLQFRVILSATGSGPAPGAITFVPATGVPNPIILPGLSANDIASFWTVGSFTNALQGSNYLGAITFTVPASAQTGQSYALHFKGVDGAPDMQTLYQLESFPATVWVNSPALQPPQITSDEWRTAFFGSPTSPLAADNVDADGDGMLNWQEYLAGTNPTNALSKLVFGTSSLNANGTPGVAFTWLTAPGKTYTLQSSPALSGATWTSIHTNVGDGNDYQFVVTNYNAHALFYQLRVNQ
jgi:sugar lactone lactonase YvrE